MIRLTLKYLTFVLVFLFQNKILAQTDAQKFGYITSIDGVSYSQLRTGNENILNNIELFSYQNGTVSNYTLVNNNQTYTLPLSGETLGFLEFNLKSSSVPVGFFVSIDSVPTHVARKISGQDLQFLFSSQIYTSSSSRTIKIDLIKKISNRTWTKVQTVTLKLQSSNTVPAPVPSPAPVGYIPPATTTWSRYPNNLIINPAQFKFGAAQLAGYNTADPCIMFDKKTNKFHAYFSSVDIGRDVQVMGHAESADGATGWTVKSTFALDIGPTNSWDQLSIETCSVHSVETSPGVFKYYLFYSATNTDVGTNGDLFKIGLATSDNPDSFTRITATQSPKGLAGQLFDVKDAFAKNTSVVNGLVTDPDVIYQDGQFKMWFFCAGQNSSGAYIEGGICYATSADGIRWTQQGSLPSLLNSSTVGLVAQQPSVVYNSDKKLYEMWVVIDDPAYANIGIPGLATGGYYYASSADGINWTYKSKTAYDFSWNKNVSSENIGLAVGCDVLYMNGFYYMYYPSFTTQNVPSGYYQSFTWGLNLATKK